MQPQISVPERLDRASLIALQTERLQTLVREVLPANPFWTQRFAAAGIGAADIQCPDDLHKLPFTTKQDLVADQRAKPPYGSNLTYDLTAYSRLHQTSGTTGAPLRCLDTPRSWEQFMESWAQIFRMVGLRREDRLCFPFSFGPFLGFWSAFEGANRLGNLCLAAGGMSSPARLRFIIENNVTFVCCTPTYALRLAEVAAEEGIDLVRSSVRGLVVAGEPGGCLGTTRQRIESAWGARVFDHWGMSELGPLATECVADPGNLYLLETECIAEIIDPVTSQPVPLGQAGPLVQSSQSGELVITTLGRWGSPLFRYRTGDIVAADRDPNPAEYHLLRLRGGIQGRTDEMLIIRGNNIYPSAIEELIRQFSTVAEYRIQVRQHKAMQHIQIEIEPQAEVGGDAADLLLRIRQTVKDRLNFQVDVVEAAPGSLPRFELKGKRFHRIIED